MTRSRSQAVRRVDDGPEPSRLISPEDPWDPFLRRLPGAAVPARLAGRRPRLVQARPLPSLVPADVTWRTLEPGLIRISVDLHNRLPAETGEGNLIVESAPLGAFAPFRAVARVPVPGLAPGESRRIHTDVPTARLGRFDSSRLGALLSGGDQWIGNLNVYFERAQERAVELHRALGLRLGAGRSYQIWIFLPEGVARDDFRVSTRCWGREWCVGTRTDARWGPMGIVRIEAAARVGSRGSATVLVTRRSDEKVVPVELSFVAVKGHGEQLGCVTL